MRDTADKLVDETRNLIVRGGYSGFSYADLSARFGIRKASIHHHFPTKVDLVVEVVERSRTGIRAQIDALAENPGAAAEHLSAYVGYWERCIGSQSLPFCLAGVLAAEMPNLPPAVAVAVRAHFDDLRRWIERILDLGVRQHAIRLDATPEAEAEAFLALVYGAMLVSRVFDDPDGFGRIVGRFTRRFSTATGAV